MNKYYYLRNENALDLFGKPYIYPKHTLFRILGEAGFRSEEELINLTTEALHVVLPAELLSKMIKNALVALVTSGEIIQLTQQEVVIARLQGKL